MQQQNLHTDIGSNHEILESDCWASHDGRGKSGVGNDPSTCAKRH